MTTDGRRHADATGNVWARVRGGRRPGRAPRARTSTPCSPRTCPTRPSSRPDGCRARVWATTRWRRGALGGRRALAPRRGVPAVAARDRGGRGHGQPRAGCAAALAAPTAPVGARASPSRATTSAGSRHVGVGSLRWRVHVPRAGRPCLGAVRALRAPCMPPPRSPHARTRLPCPAPVTTVNIGSIGGGEAINASARDAWFELDLRADDRRGACSNWRTGRRASSPRHAVTGLDVKVAELGRRPRGRSTPCHPLALAAVGRAGARGHRRRRSCATSTDANAAHERGDPRHGPWRHHGRRRAHAPGVDRDHCRSPTVSRRSLRPFGTSEGSADDAGRGPASSCRVLSRPVIPRHGRGDRVRWGSPSVAHRLLAPRAQLLRLSHLGRPRVATVAPRHRRDEPAHAPPGHHRDVGCHRRRDIRGPDDPGYRRR